MVSPSIGLSSPLDPIPENLLRHPIDFICADHYRQRVLCDILDSLVFEPDRDSARDDMAAVLAYLRTDLPLHVADEEEDLLPRLLIRAEPGDRIRRMLLVLSEEHESDRELVARLVRAIEPIVAGDKPPDDASFLKTAAAFAATQRRHIDWEERVVFPLARMRLTRDDLAEIGQEMAARRGASPPVA